MPVAVVMVAYGAATGLAAAVAAVLQQRPQELVLVDNGCHAGALEFLRDPGVEAQATVVRRVPMGCNVGFAAGSNAGVAHSRAPFVLFLNDDAVLRPGYLPLLLAGLLARPEAASAVGKIVYRAKAQAGRAQAPGVPQYIDSAGLVLHRYALRPQDRGQDAVDGGQYDVPRAIFGPTGAAALYRRAAFCGAGGFAADFFAYYEDVDLAWRLGRAGWLHLYVPAAVAHHRRRGPDGKPTSVAVRAFTNRYRTILRNASWWGAVRRAPVALPWEAARLLRQARRRPRFVAQVVATLPRLLAQELARRRTAQVPRGPHAGGRCLRHGSVSPRPS